MLRKMHSRELVIALSRKAYLKTCWLPIIWRKLAPFKEALDKHYGTEETLHLTNQSATGDGPHVLRVLQ